MADKLYNKTAERGAIELMELIPQFEHFLETVLDKYVKHEINKLEDIKLEQIIGIKKERFNDYHICKIVGLKEDNLRSVLEKYEIDDYKICRDYDGQKYLAFKREGDTRFKLDNLFKDFENGKIDFERVYEEYNNKHGYAQELTSNQKVLLNERDRNGLKIFDPGQKEELEMAFRHGIQVNQISQLLLKDSDGLPIYNSGQMREIRLAAEEHLTARQLDVISEVKNGVAVNDARKMNELREAFGDQARNRKNPDDPTAGDPAFNDQGVESSDLQADENKEDDTREGKDGEVTERDSEQGENGDEPSSESESYSKSEEDSSGSGSQKADEDKSEPEEDQIPNRESDDESGHNGESYEAEDAPINDELRDAETYERASDDIEEPDEVKDHYEDSNRTENTNNASLNDEIKDSESYESTSEDIKDPSDVNDNYSTEFNNSPVADDNYSYESHTYDAPAEVSSNRSSSDASTFDASIEKDIIDSNNISSSREALFAPGSSNNLGSNSFQTTSDDYRTRLDSAERASIDKANETRDRVNHAEPFKNVHQIGSGNDLIANNHNNMVVNTPSAPNHSSVNSSMNYGFKMLEIETDRKKGKLSNYAEDSGKAYTDPTKVNGTDFRTGYNKVKEVWTVMSARALQQTANHASKALYASLSLSQMQGTGKSDNLKDFITANGGKYSGFGSKSRSDSTLIELEKALNNRKLDLKGLSKEIRQAKTSKNWDSVAKKLGFVNARNSKYDTLRVQLLCKDIIKVNRIKEMQKLANKKALKSLHVSFNKVFGATEFGAGVNRIVKVIQRIKKTYKFAKTSIKLAQKVFAAGASFVRSVSPSARARYEKRLRNEELRKKAASNIKNIRDRKKAKENLRKKAAKKRKREERLNKSKIGKKYLNERRKATERFDRFKNSKILQGTRKALNGVKAVGRNVKIAFMKVMKVVETIKEFNPANLVMVGVQFGLSFIEKWVMIILGIFAAFCSALSLVISAVSMIISFFVVDDGEWTIENSIMGKAYVSLINQQQNWTESMKSQKYHSDMFNKLRYGKDYLDKREYAKTIDGIVSVNEDGSMYGNPFPFVPNNSDVFKKLNKFDGGYEVYIENSSGSERTSNIKDIICMTNVYLGYGDTAVDPDEETPWYSVVGSWITGNGEIAFMNYAEAEGYEVQASDKLDDRLDTIHSTSGGFKKYANEVFAASHQNYVDLEYKVLPTAYSIGRAVGSADETKYKYEMKSKSEHLFAYDKVNECPDADKNGCKSSNSFGYNFYGGKIRGGLYDENNHFFPVDDLVYIDNDKERCMISNADEMTIDGLIGYLSGSHKECWNYRYASSENKTTTTEYDTERKEPTQSDAARRFSSMISGIDKDSQIVEIKNVSKNTSYVSYKVVFTKIDVKEIKDSYVLVNGEKKVPTLEDIKKSKKDKSYKIEEKEVITYEETVSEQVAYVVWKCHFNHKGSYCGGHLRNINTGFLFTITDEQLEYDENDIDIVSKLADDEEIIYDPRDTKTHLIGAEPRDAIDIFDIDHAYHHSTQMSEWEGWTKSNMEMVIHFYNMDWKEIYGFDISDAINTYSIMVGCPFDVPWDSSNISSPFGPRQSPGGIGSSDHAGIDISWGGIEGTPVYAGIDGIVINANSTYYPNGSGSGNWVVIQSTVSSEEVEAFGSTTAGYQVQYMHLKYAPATGAEGGTIYPDKETVHVGDIVHKGDLIGYVGNTGGSTGPHLHLAVLEATEPSIELINDNPYKVKVVGDISSSVSYREVYMLFGMQGRIWRYKDTNEDVPDEKKENMVYEFKNSYKHINPIFCVAQTPDFVNEETVSEDNSSE